jgi:transcriptional regulator with XRE-family HTH domain
MLNPNQISHAREALSLSQRELARRANISRTALNQFEQGKGVPGPYFSRKLRDYFEVAGVDIAARAETPQSPSATAENAACGGLSAVEPDQRPATVPKADDEIDLSGAILMLLGLGLSVLLGRRIGH